MSKTVCILRSNPVNPDSRVEKEAAALKKAGYKVRIIAWERSENSKPKKECIEVYSTKIGIIRFGHIATYGEGFKNLKSFLLFQLSMNMWLLKNRNKYDIIHACDFDTACFSFFMAKLFKKKFIFDIFDYICGEPHNLFQYMVKKHQNFIINHSDATIICTEERIKQIKGTKPKNLTVIHNTPKVNETRENGGQANNGKKVKIVYVGILQDYRLLKEIADGMKYLDDCELHVGGFGKYEQDFIEYSKTQDNIYFYGKMPYANTIELEKKCDIMLAIYNPIIENHRFAAPNKFYESLMLGKPVIMAQGTGMSEEVRKNDIGVLIEYSVEGFLYGVRELINRKSEWPNMSQKMKLLYFEKYNWNKMEKRLINLYQFLCED